MGARTEQVVPSRFKREDCNRTKHDSAFSDWKVLIGPYDWEDHSLGKEGAERYRVHNLPNCSSCSGLYELGIAVSQSRSGRESSKLDPDRIIPVYLGQAENVRTRLQRYGREGAHLETGKFVGELNDSVQQGLGLFSEIFSRGCSVVYRWAPMKNKIDAEKTEAQLLDTFDYAWNKGSNGVRRPNDILKNLDRSTSRNTRFRAIANKLLTFHENEMGIKIVACKPENGSGTYSNQDNYSLLSQILKIGRSQPRLVSVRYGLDEDNTSICGVALGRGSICRRLPIEGRKRCAEHKGMKVNGFTSKLITEEKKLSYECDGYNAPSSVKPEPVADNHPLGNDLFPICGVTSEAGTLCQKQPVRGRKRCEEHKGRKITTQSLSVLGTENKQQVPSEMPVINKTDKICGLDLKDGAFCRRRPVVGRKRCEEHKGMRIARSKCRLVVEDRPS